MATVRYRKSKVEKPPERSIIKSLIFTILTLLVMTMVVLSLQLLRKGYSIHPISGTSMRPTLTEKDMVLIKKDLTVLRYDVIAFSIKEEDGKFVKRVIGLPGDHFFIRNDRMTLNVGDYGEFETTYTFRLSPSVAEEFQSLNQIPMGMYFTIGDHIDVSKDSRTFGFVHKKNIEGTVKLQLPNILKPKEEN